MRILFAITALCLFVLLWAGLAIRRHIRAAARERAERQQPPAKAAIELELKQELRAQQEEKGFFGSLSDPRPSRHSVSRTRAEAVRDSALRATAAKTSPAPASEPVKVPKPVNSFEVSQSEPAEAVVSQEETHTSVTSGEEFRKPPVSTGVEFERLDLAKFNSKDPGDLSDPYQVPRTATRNRS